MHKLVSLVLPNNSNDTEMEGDRQTDRPTDRQTERHPGAQTVYVQEYRRT